MDGRRRVLIIDFINCTQRYSALPSKWRSELRKQNPDFLCFILDEILKKIKKKMKKYAITSSIG
jgi:hypothetical protein